MVREEVPKIISQGESLTMEFTMALRKYRRTHKHRLTMSYAMVAGVPPKTGLDYDLRMWAEEREL